MRHLDCGHARVVPALDLVGLHKPGQLALAEHSVDQGEARVVPDLHVRQPRPYLHRQTTSLDLVFFFCDKDSIPAACIPVCIAELHGDLCDTVISPLPQPQHLNAAGLRSTNGAHADTQSSENYIIKCRGRHYKLGPDCRATS